jgi:hypothetical protein
LAPGEAKEKAIGIFHDLANKENEERDRQNNPANELYVVAGGEVGGFVDPIRALGDHALEGGIAVMPGNGIDTEIM